MLFNSIDFAFFLPVVFCLYWFVTNRSVKSQNLLLLVASYYFYACWDWRFLLLLLFSTGLDFYTGIRTTRAGRPQSKRTWLWSSIVIKLALLGVFKYYNFFVGSFAAALEQIGFQAHLTTLQIILPLGISFYTFHGLSYVIDVYHGKVKAEKNFIDYAVFVSFFPLLVAGPIERATHLLPQIKQKRIFRYAAAVDGLRQILWGLFKKVVIADRCGQWADHIFNHSAEYSGPVLVLGAVLFAIQIYGDFSGYSDIALGTARLFGIEVLRNFAFPYFSRDIAEFWRRWHISLSTWFRDYLYIPMGGSRGGTWKKIRNVFVIFIVSGWWHGANWTFIVWGALHAVYYLPLLLTHRNRKHLDTVASGRILPSPKEALRITVTFSLVVFAWIFFRAENIGHAVDYIGNMFNGLLQPQQYSELFEILSIQIGYKTFLLLFFFLAVEWQGREQPYAIARLGLQWSRTPRYIMYYLIILAICWSGGTEQKFIYFQF